MKLLLVMEHRTLGESLMQVLSNQGVSVTGLVPDLGQVPGACNKETPDLLLFDPPPGAQVVAQLKAVIDQVDDVAVVLLAEPENRTDWIAAGVRGFLPPDRPVSDLMRALDSALRQDEVFEPGVAYQLFSQLATLERKRRLERQSQVSVLTNREREILGLLCEGLGNPKIASRLGLSPHTVKNHVHQILSKLGVDTRWEAAAKAQRRGWARNGSEG